MPDPKVSDKAPWDQGSVSIVRGAMAGAKAGEEEFPEMKLESLDIELSERAKFRPDGTALMDTDEPGVTPIKVTYRFVRDNTPKLENP